MSDPPLPAKVDRQREHQANERTFLAWVRTSIALIGFGFAISRFSLFLYQWQGGSTGGEHFRHPFLNAETLGIALVIGGIGLIILSAWRYNQVLRMIEQGNYVPNRWVIGLTALLVVGMGVLSLPLLWWKEPSFHPEPGSSPTPPSNLDP